MAWACTSRISLSLRSQLSKNQKRSTQTTPNCIITWVFPISKLETTLKQWNISRDASYLITHTLTHIIILPSSSTCTWYTKKHLISAAKPRNSIGTVTTPTCIGHLLSLKKAMLWKLSRKSEKVSKNSPKTQIIGWFGASFSDRPVNIKAPNINSQRLSRSRVNTRLPSKNYFS